MSADATAWTFRHSAATGATLQVHLAIADSVNDQHGNELWMKVDSLAEKARVSRATAQRALHWLEEQGYLELLTERTGGRARPAHYAFLFPDLPVLYDARKGRVVRGFSETERASPRAERASTARAKGPHGEARIKATQEKQPKRSQENNTAPAAPSLLPVRSLDAEFADWWSIYPRHSERKAARAKFEVVRRTVPLEALLDGARRYRDDPNRVDGFTKHPAVWLNKGCWDDDPLPPRNGHRPSRRDEQVDRLPGVTADAYAMARQSPLARRAEPDPPALGR